ncbi:DUF2249 domain-containing protein [Propionicimonas sp.]|uniref:DUF2249 domain-containing protein n=1 Tax=Propionicimonas sp. TaxID=1955623 RepID=UPI0039E26330
MQKTVHLENAGVGGCACGHHDEGDPVLDVRAIPHAIRHATVIGAFGAIPAGGALVLVAPHNPLPLLGQLAALAPIEVEYLLEDPQEWRLRITRAG